MATVLKGMLAKPDAQSRDTIFLLGADGFSMNLEHKNEATACRAPMLSGAAKLVVLMCMILHVGCDTRRNESGPSNTATTTQTGFSPEAVANKSRSGENLPFKKSDTAFQFTSMYSQSGISFEHHSGDGPEKPFPAANGSGIGVIDIDHDGLYDLLFLTGNAFDETSVRYSNRCYRNGRSWEFADVSDACSLDFSGHSAGVAVGDYNSDGFSDVYLNCFGENQLFENLGDGTFKNVSRLAQVDNRLWGTSAAFLDIDGDGFLDLYVGNYAQWSNRDNVFCGDHEKKIRMFCSPKSVIPEPDVLYRNQGDGTFNDISMTSGILTSNGRTQGVIAGDLTGDGRVDLYISNDLNPNLLLVNQGEGQFIDQADAFGAAYDRSGVAQAGMGLGCADANRDGYFDLFVTNFEGEHNAYYEQDGAGYFNDVSHLRGLAAASLPWIGWGTAFADFDLDGWPDVVVNNGHTDTNMKELGREGEYRQPALLWRNEKGKFSLLKPANSPYFQEPHAGRALVIADLDNDSDWDLICGHQDSAPELLRNDVHKNPNTVVLQLRLLGDALNRDACGAVVRCQVGDRVYQEQVFGGGSYLCASDSRVVLALDSLTLKESVNISVVWGPGHSTEFTLPPVSCSVFVRGSRCFSANDALD